MIILFGLAGSGKGTQGNALAELFGWRWISTGQLVRNTGKFDHIINDGNIISDADIEELLAKELDKDEAEGFDVILEGFPRTAAQAQWLLDRKTDWIDGAIILDVPKEELYQRLTLRANADSRVDDQTKASIDRRFEIFEQNIYSILPLFETKNIPVETVSGVGEISEVTARLTKVVQKMTANANIQKNDVNNGGEIENSYGE